MPPPHAPGALLARAAASKAVVLGSNPSRGSVLAPEALRHGQPPLKRCAQARFRVRLPAGALSPAVLPRYHGQRRVKRPEPRVAVLLPGALIAYSPQRREGLRMLSNLLIRPH